MILPVTCSYGSLIFTALYILLWLYHSLLTYFRIDEHLGCVQSLGILNNDAMDIPLCVFLGPCFPFLGPAAESRIAGLWGMYGVNLSSNCHPLLQHFCPICTTPSRVQSSVSSLTLILVDCHVRQPTLDATACSATSRVCDFSYIYWLFGVHLLQNSFVCICIFVF